MLRLYDPDKLDLSSSRLPDLSVAELDRRLVTLLSQIDRPVLERVEAIKDLFGLKASQDAMRRIPIDAYIDKDGL